MTKASTAAALALAMALTGCGAARSRLTKGEVSDVIDQAPQRGAYFEAIGIGASDSTLKSATQRKALSRDAAIVKAQYELLSMIKGVGLEGGITVDRAIETDSSLSTRVMDTIRGAEIVKSEYTSDLGCVVTMRLPKKRLESELGARLR